MAPFLSLLRSGESELHAQAQVVSTFVKHVRAALGGDSAEGALSPTSVDHVERPGAKIAKNPTERHALIHSPHPFSSASRQFGRQLAPRISPAPHAPAPAPQCPGGGTVRGQHDRRPLALPCRATSGYYTI